MTAAGSWRGHQGSGKLLAGCRCDGCVAYRERAKETSAIRRNQGLPPGDPRHGTVNGYNNYGCRCAPCSVEVSLYKKNRSGS